MYRLLLLSLVLCTQVYTAEVTEEIIVIGDRSSSENRMLTYSFDIIKVDDIEDLDNVVGVDLVRTGPTGQQTSLFTRGTNSNHTLIALNGVAIKDHSTISGSDDIGKLRATGIDKIEIILGPMGAVYGANAIGGVINMHSVASKKNKFFTHMGNREHFTHKLSWGNEFDDHTFSFDISYENNPYAISVNPSGTEPDPYTFRDINLNYSVDLSQSESIFVNSMNRNHDISLDAYNGDDLDYVGKWKMTNNQFIYANNNTMVAVNQTSHDRTYTDGDKISSYISDVDTLLVHTTLDNFTYGVELENVSASFDINGDWGYNSYNTQESRQNRGAFFGYDDKNYTIGVRHDDLYSITTYRIGGQIAGFRTSWATGFKAPTLYELFGKDTFGFNGNPNLAPERSETVEIGYGNIVTLFYTELTDMHTYSNSTYSNSETVQRIKGAEFNYGIGPFSFNYTYLDVGKDVLRRPKHKATIKLFGRGHTFRATYTGEHRDIHSALFTTIDMDAVTLYDYDYRLSIDEFGSLVFGVDNIMDKSYQSPHGYSQRGREIYMRLEYEF